MGLDFRAMQVSEGGSVPLSSSNGFCEWIRVRRGPGGHLLILLAQTERLREPLWLSASVGECEL